MQVRKQQLELDMEQQNGSKQGEEYIKTVYCHPAYLTYIQSTDDTTPMAESEEELKILLMKVKVESEKVGLKLIIQKTKIPKLHGKQMGKQWKQCQALFLGAPKSLQMVIAAMKLKDAYSLEGKL